MPLKKHELIAACVVLAVTALLFIDALVAATDRTHLVSQLIAEGHVEDARLLLASLIETEYANSERCYLAGCLTEDADSAYICFLKAIELANDRDIYALSLIAVANYHLAARQYHQGLELVDRHRQKCKESDHYPELENIRALLRVGVGKQKKSVGDLKKALKRSGDPEVTARLLLTLGDIRMSQGKYDDAAAYYHKLANRSDERYAGAVLLRLVDTYLADSDYDNAQFSYTMLSSRYPATLGLSDLQARFATTGVSEAAPPGAEPDRQDISISSRRPVLYAVRVGTFRKASNAEKLRRRYARRGYTVTVTRVQISGGRYYVVDLGRFESKTEATAFKKKLEKQNHSSYHVVKL